MTEQSYEIKVEDAGTRVDKLLTDQKITTSRSQVQAWIKDEYVQVNGKGVKPNYKCLLGDKITWTVPEVKGISLEPENIPLDIIFEDDDVIVINKARGMVVHPSLGHDSGTLVHALLHHSDTLSGLNGPERPGIVHRIDKDTSGLLVVAKNDEAHESLSNQLIEHTIERVYEAVVHDVIDHDTGLIDAPIGRNPQERQNMAVVSAGKSAITYFQVLEKFEDYTYVECRLETGRTHQIRVHMKYIGHPIAGDPKYGRNKTLKLDGQALHAKRIGFDHPKTGERLTFTAPAPEYFHELLEKLSLKH